MVLNLCIVLIFLDWNLVVYLKTGSEDEIGILDAVKESRVFSYIILPLFS